jgi:hypothetical protein
MSEAVILKARRRVLDVTAVKFNHKEWGDGKHQCQAYYAVHGESCPRFSKDGKVRSHWPMRYFIDTPFGPQTLRDGYYLVVHPNGEVYALPPKLFHHAFRVIA